MGLIKPSKVDLDNKIYSVSLSGQFTDSLDYPATSSEKFIIDSLGNFVLEIKNLDNFANQYTLQGFFVDGLTEIINKYNITLGKNYQAVFSYAENGLSNMPYACGCIICLGVTETSDLYFRFNEYGDGISIPIGASAIITGKLY